MTQRAGPVSPAADILLWLCLDGLRGTQRCGSEELARIADALRAVGVMAALQRSVQQVLSGHICCHPIPSCCCKVVQSC